jgi:molecular chaperone DnaK (HSP70)
MNGQVKIISAEEIAALILGKMKQIAETNINKNVSNVVITVPHYFTVLQCQSIENAAKITGFKSIRMVNGQQTVYLKITFCRAIRGRSFVLCKPN